MRRELLEGAVLHCDLSVVLRFVVLNRFGLAATLSR